MPERERQTTHGRGSPPTGDVEVIEAPVTQQRFGVTVPATKCTHADFRACLAQGPYLDAGECLGRCGKHHGYKHHI